MSRAERGGRRRFSRWLPLLGLLTLLLTGRALAQAGSAPGQVRVVLVNGDGDRVHFGERLRTLFDSTTAVEFQEQPELVSAQVLDPARADTIYVFITFSKRGRALVYVATRESGASNARYLLREVDLDSGLDEVGAETVAQVAHSSAMALWSRRAETPPDAVAGELAREEQTSSADTTRAASVAPARKQPERTQPVRTQPVRTQPERLVARRPGSSGVPAVSLRFGAELAAHASGDEGWLVSPGVFAGFVALGRFGLRLQASYLLPSRFDVSPALVEISGFGAEARASVFLFRSPDVRARFDAGAGLLRVRWEAQEILSAEGSDWSLSSERESRPYLVAAVAAELPVSSLFDAALRTELRLLTPPARYDIAVEEARQKRAEVRFAPGVALELWLPQER